MQANRHYVLGGHTFDNVNDYWNAQHDMKIIEIIRRDLDVSDPEVAIRLYNMIRDGVISFATPIGQEFTEHVTDVLADKSINLIDTKKSYDAAGKKVRPQRFIGLGIAAAAVIAVFIFGGSQLSELLNTQKLEAMAASTRAAKVDDDARREIEALNTLAMEAAQRAKSVAATEEDIFNPTVLVNENDLQILPEYTTLVAQNGDLKGWLSIPDTNVDYPVLQRAGDTENAYYLKRDFEGNEDANGSLFVDYRSNTVNPTENTIIYGHNMNSGKMFGDLKNYLDEEFYERHKTVRFDTLYEEREYEIVAVCLSKVQDADSNNFRYYNFIDAKNALEWDAFVTTVNSLSVFSLDSGLKPGDEVLTLSTCNNYVEDGRLFLVAKRVV